MDNWSAVEPGSEMRREFAWILVILLAGTGSLLGQDERTGYEIGVYAAGQDWKARTFQIAPAPALTPIALGFQYKHNRIGYGIRANFLSQGHWGGELSYSYQRNALSLTRQAFTPVTLGGGIHHVFYNEVFYPVRYGGPVMPFVTGGIGLAAYHLNSKTLSDAANPAVYGLGSLKRNEEKLALNYGAGVKSHIAPHVGIRADFRHIFTDVPTWGLPGQPPVSAQLPVPPQGKLQNFEFSIGIYFRGMAEAFR